jgi:hypothetical protein
MRTSKMEKPGKPKPPGLTLRRVRYEIEYVLKLQSIPKVLQIYIFLGGIRKGPNWVMCPRGVSRQ